MRSRGARKAPCMKRWRGLKRTSKDGPRAQFCKKNFGSGNIWMRPEAELHMRRVASWRSFSREMSYTGAYLEAISQDQSFCPGYDQPPARVAPDVN